jgi:hypothetical protein
MNKSFDWIRPLIREAYAQLDNADGAYHLSRHSVDRLRSEAGARESFRKLYDTLHAHRGELNDGGMSRTRPLAEPL